METIVTGANLNQLVTGGPHIVDDFGLFSLIYYIVGMDFQIYSISYKYVIQFNNIIIPTLPLVMDYQLYKYH